MVSSSKSSFTSRTTATMFFLAAFLVVVTPTTAASNDNNNHNMLRSLARRLGFENAVDTTETVYAEAAQAWRMLGLYTDCQAQEDGSSLCERYLLWAAYVDESYEGAGQGEYAFYNAETGKWDESACEVAGSERCVRMDCHLPNTHFKLLGYYKQYGVNDFFEQLFAHQGSCTWSQSDYYFMENSRQSWPQGCTQSAATDENGSAVYYDIKPLSGGRMTIGLYHDAQCSVTYSGSLTVEEAMQVDDENNNNGSSGPTVGSAEWLDEWNSALDVYRTCQPCLVSSLSNSARRRERRQLLRRLEEDGAQDDAAAAEEEQYQDDDGFFTCQDAAGNQGANQCALFAQNTDVRPATFRDVRLATLQGSITRANLAGATSSRAQKWWRAWGFFTIAAVIFVIGVLMFCCFVKVKRRTFHGNANEPLLGSSNRSQSSTSNRSTKSKSSSTRK